MTAPALSKVTQRAIGLLSLATFTSMTSQRVCDAMLPELARVFGVPLSAVAPVISYFAIAYGLMQLVYGPVGERHGKFRTVMWALIGCAMGCMVCAWGPSLEVLIAARILTALAAAAIIPLAMAWVGDAVCYEVRQETLARVGLGTMLGLAGGQVFGGVMSDTLGWRWAFGLLSVLFVSVSFFMWRHEPHLAPATPSPVAQQSWIAPLIWLARDRWARVILGIALVEGALVFGVMAISATHLHLTHGLSLALAGMVTALFGLGGMLYMSAARQVIRRFGEVGLARWGGGFMAACFALLAWTPIWQLAMPTCLLAGFSFAMFHNTMQAKATQIAPTARATGVTVFAGFLFWGQSLGVWMLAYGMQEHSTRVLITMMALGVACLGWFFARAIDLRNAFHPA